MARLHFSITITRPKRAGSSHVPVQCNGHTPTTHLSQIPAIPALSCRSSRFQEAATVKQLVSNLCLLLLYPRRSEPTKTRSLQAQKKRPSFALARALSGLTLLHPAFKILKAVSKIHFCKSQEFVDQRVLLFFRREGRLSQVSKQQKLLREGHLSQVSK